MFVFWHACLSSIRPRNPVQVANAKIATNYKQDKAIHNMMLHHLQAWLITANTNRNTAAAH